eukprot:1112533-Alexandrium_andersonii.AAC.1
MPALSLHARALQDKLASAWIVANRRSTLESTLKCLLKLFSCREGTRPKRCPTRAANNKMNMFHFGARCTCTRGAC